MLKNKNRICGIYISKDHLVFEYVFKKKFLVLVLQVVLLQEVEGDIAEELVNKCPVKVFDIEDIGKGKLTCKDLM